MARQQLQARPAVVAASALYEDGPNEPDSTGQTPIGGNLLGAVERACAELERRREPPSAAELGDILDVCPGPLDALWPEHLPPGAPSDDILSAYLENALPEHLRLELLARPWSEAQVQRLCELEEEARAWEERVLNELLGPPTDVDPAR